jgi:hypothetical protein
MITLVMGLLPVSVVDTDTVGDRRPASASPGADYRKSVTGRPGGDAPTCTRSEGRRGELPQIGDDELRRNCIGAR